MIIVNYNTRSDLQTCLQALEPEAAAVIVVDNASTDGSPAMVRARFPWARLQANEDNRGYGAGANDGLALCETPYALVLNSDTRPLPGALAALADYLDRRPQVGMAGPRLLNPDRTLQPSCFHYPSPGITLLQEIRVARLAARIPYLRERYLPAWPHDRSRPVPWVLGAALAIRRSAFEAVGGFDEGFFMYFEEVDLCYRLVRAGWEVHFTPEAEVIHSGAASTRQQRAAMAAQLYRSLRKFYRRHYPGQQGRLRLVMSYILARNLARDGLKQLRADESGQRRRLQEDVRIWKDLLRSFWEV